MMFTLRTLVASVFGALILTTGAQAHCYRGYRDVYGWHCHHHHHHCHWRDGVRYCHWR